MKVSVIIPALNESLLLKETLQAVRHFAPHELIVVDGGSRDGTADLVRPYATETITSAAGRGLQMNAGAARATGDLLLFLHADSRLDMDGYGKMVRTMSEGDWAGGAFSLSIDAQGPAMKIISRLATLRARYLNLVYGDQAIFVRARVFREIGGFPCIPICEDLDFFRKLRKNGPVILLEEKVVTSGRRWNSEGIALTTGRNFLIAGLFLLGFPPRILSSWYRAIR